ncbi:hypothetical protein IV203_000699 [Nitzschia inconspicua]|uniref:START domain-containing protein n=1 Tax=Nitzschia inconspicua TaxID=303405 RepID=A0A9K3L746_9STRA|nr:hypothetical protein IV203_000699 [Nitzschia inconspicua]
MAMENERNNFGGLIGVDEMNGHSSTHGPRGFRALQHSESLPWKTIETSRRGPVSHIDRIDNFNGLDAPLLRFRATLDGPCVADPLASLIMDLEERSKWDIQIQDVFEAHTIQDLPSANAAIGFAYGDCYRLGVGYCRTKKNLGIDSREQLTLCGINNFSDGSAMIWGVELPEQHNDLMPSHYHRVTRAKSHLFSTTLVPTGESSFDVEYLLQLEIGGKIPTWMTTPIVMDSVKRMFKCAKDVYANHKAIHPSVASESLLLSP